VSTLSIAETWRRWSLLALLSALLGSCAAPPPTETAGRPVRPGRPSPWMGYVIGVPPTPSPALKRALIARAIQEWQYFGRQTVVFRGLEESIPHVGEWEDDDASHSSRVAVYWRAAGKPGVTGMDCQKPWSAAFISWIMQSAGVPQSQFTPAPAHWIYLSGLVQSAGLPGRYFVPRRPTEYSPKPGDLICASRGPSRISWRDGYISSAALEGMSAHCDLVVNKTGRTLEAIGGNVRNSVSKSSLELDARGRLLHIPKRPWIMVIQNRL
jgi:hypothetical protein